MLIPIIVNRNEKKSCLICKKFITEKCENIGYNYIHNSHCTFFEYAKCKNIEFSYSDFPEREVYVYKQIYNK